jgi:non-canonical (house-cleaning) NTP pyrophosphatase
VTGVNDVRSKQGMIGVVTGGFVDRTEEYSSIAKLALGLWYGREWNS